MKQVQLQRQDQRRVLVTAPTPRPDDEPDETTGPTGRKFRN
jgi:hypothetical protein